MAPDRLKQPWHLSLGPTCARRPVAAPAAASPARPGEEGPVAVADACWLGSRRTRGYYLNAIQQGR